MELMSHEDRSKLEMSLQLRSKASLWSVEEAIAVLVDIEIGSGRVDFSTNSQSSFNRILKEKSRFVLDGIDSGDLVTVENSTKNKLIDSNNAKSLATGFFGASLLRSLPLLPSLAPFFGPVGLVALGAGGITSAVMLYRKEMSSRDKKMLEKSLVPDQVEKFARSHGQWLSDDFLPKEPLNITPLNQEGEDIHPGMLPDRTRKHKCPSAEYVAQQVEILKSTDTPAVQGKLGKVYPIVACIEWYLQEALERSNPRCLCRHDKLVDMAFEYAVNEDGALLRECFDPKRLHNLILKEAGRLVPRERQPRSELYDSGKCNCPIETHQNYKVKRRGFSKQKK